MAARWRRAVAVPAAAMALLAGGSSGAWASGLAVMPAAPAQIVATVPSGPLIINVPPPESLLHDLGAAHGRHVLEGDRAEVLYGIRIVDIRPDGALPWVMTVDAVPGRITVTIG